MRNGFRFQIGVGKTVKRIRFDNGTMRQTALDLRLLAITPGKCATGAVRKFRSTNGRSLLNEEFTISRKNVLFALDGF